MSLPHVSGASARRSFPRPALHVLLASLLATLAACVTVDGTLKPDGSGTLEMMYRVARKSTETLEKRRFTSPQVRLESLKLKEDGTAVVKLSFDDPTKLSTLEMFRSVSIARHREGEDERFTVTVTVTPLPIEIEEAGKPGPTISIALPGKVLEANRDATVDGNRVTWRFTLVKFATQKTVDLTARYHVSPAGQAPGSEAPTKAGGGDKEPAAEK